MPQYRLVVATDAVEGREDEYNDWHTHQHLPDTLRVPGFVSGQRFKLRSVVMGEIRNRYLTIYTMETDDPEQVFALTTRLSGTDAMPFSDALDLASTNIGVFEIISEEMFAPPPGNV
jgi:hypothetical protein